MKENKGITLVVLVITIIVFMIVIGITINYGVSELRQTKNEKLETELSLVQSAIIQQYALMKTKQEDGQVATKITANTDLKEDEGRPTDLIGKRISDESTLTANDFTSYLIKYGENMTYEQYYYILDENDLRTLGIQKGDVPTDGTSKSRSYIVNYSTGEVFDVANKKYQTDGNVTNESIYLEGTSSSLNSTAYNYTDE